MPLLVGTGAVGIDVAQWTLAKRHLQRAADTAALAGGQAHAQKVAITSAVDQTLLFNNQVPLSSKLIENAPTAGPFAGDASAVRVVLTTSPELSFVSFFMPGPTVVRAEATAKAMPDPRHCLVALEDQPQVGFDFSGSTGVHLDCGIMTNSRAKPSAVTFGGSAAIVSAPEVSAVGSLRPAPNWASGTKLMPNQAKLPDPFANAPEASTYGTNCGPAMTIEGSSNAGKTLSPGCWAGLNIKTKVTLSPGVYVVKGSSLTFAAGADVSSTGPVTFVLTGDNSASIATLSISSNTIINLNAPTSGPLKDLLFYQDRRAKYNSSENGFTGNAGSTFGGSVYFPGSNLNYTGNSGTSGVCIKLVARKMTFTGNSSATISCTGAARETLLGEAVRLVA